VKPSGGYAQISMWTRVSPSKYRFARQSGFRQSLWQQWGGRLFWSDILQATKIRAVRFEVGEVRDLYYPRCPVARS